MEDLAQHERVRGHQIDLLVLGQKHDLLGEDALNEVTFCVCVAELDVGLARGPEEVLLHVFHELLVLAALNANCSPDVNQVLLKRC